MILENIQKRRKQLDLTQGELAKLADVSQSALAKIESKRMNPSFDIAKRIFDALESQEHETSAKASDVMSKKVITVKSLDTVETAVSLMKKHGISQLPVFEKGHLVGLVTESALIENLDRPNLRSQKISKVMLEAPPTIPEDSPVKLISELLKYNPILIVYKKAELVGVICKSDLLKVV
jgi:predicted transcriptional regulator